MNLFEVPQSWVIVVRGSMEGGRIQYSIAFANVHGKDAKYKASARKAHSPRTSSRRDIDRWGALFVCKSTLSGAIGGVYIQQLE